MARTRKRNRMSPLLAANRFKKQGDISLVLRTSEGRAVVWLDWPSATELQSILADMLEGDLVRVEVDDGHVTKERARVRDPNAGREPPPRR